MKKRREKRGGEEIEDGGQGSYLQQLSMLVIDQRGRGVREGSNNIKMEREKETRECAFSRVCSPCAFGAFLVVYYYAKDMQATNNKQKEKQREKEPPPPPPLPPQQHKRRGEKKREKENRERGERVEATTTTTTTACLSVLVSQLGICLCVLFIRISGRKKKKRGGGGNNKEKGVVKGHRKEGESREKRDAKQGGNSSTLS